METTQKGIGMPEERGDVRKEELDVGSSAEYQAVFEETSRRLEIPFAKIEVADGVIGQDLAVRVVSDFGDPKRFVPEGNPVGELSQLGKGLGKIAPGEHRGKALQTEALLDEITAKGLDGSPVVVHRPWILATKEVGHTEVKIRQDLDVDVLYGLSDREGTLARVDGAIVIGHDVEEAREIAEYSTQPALIAESSGKALGLAEVVKESGELSEGEERIAHVEPEIDRLLGVLPPLGKVLQDIEPLLEPHGRLLVSRAINCFSARLPEVLESSVPDLAADAMVTQPLDMFVEASSVKRFDGVHDSGMKGASSPLKQAPVRDFVREGVLERVFEVGEQARLVEELRTLQVREGAAQLRLGELGDGLQQGEGYILADDRRCVEELLLHEWQSVDPGRQDRLHGRGDVNGLEGLSEASGVYACGVESRSSVAPTVTGWAHSGQNLAVGGSWARQFPQLWASSGAAHCSQNLARGPFAC